MNTIEMLKQIELMKNSVDDMKPMQVAPLSTLSIEMISNSIEDQTLGMLCLVLCTELTQLQVEVKKQHAEIEALRVAHEFFATNSMGEKH